MSDKSTELDPNKIEDFAFIGDFPYFVPQENSEADKGDDKNEYECSRWSEEQINFATKPENHWKYDFLGDKFYYGEDGPMFKLAFLEGLEPDNSGSLQQFSFKNINSQEADKRTVNPDKVNFEVKLKDSISQKLYKGRSKFKKRLF
ncbi:uncharacterized protein LOC115889497 [Sitophilus oryzae]|uniref:Uncharacterized protein LOC115889497 n=1 Tax=Sitophilus oryzae TaxID=7048 RepID=A0A6J2YPU2_SITOR|nr:uncharacterized protein LOC115889497 [Sitophilus oryzae]